MSETNSSSDWIYILLTLLTIGLSMVKSLSKKDKKTDAVSSSPENDTEELPEFDWENTIVERHTDIEEKTDTTYSFKPEHEGGTREYSRTATNEENDSDTGETDFDLKKAVIYNEILNRKYE